MNICIIPARGGSKRIPKKNIKEFNGQPVIAYSIKAALNSGCFDQVVVSTDDEDIAKIAQSLGASTPFVRPNELSDDHAGTLPVIQHTIQWFESRDIQLEKACCLYATAPFVSSKAINESLDQMVDANADYCFSATRFEFPIQRAIKINTNNRVQMFTPEFYNSRSQDLEEAYHDAGQFYWGNVKTFLDGVDFFSEVATPYIIPKYLVQDIDTMEDWVRAEAMHRVLMERGLFESSC